jgi:hypothetical protein
MEAGEVENSNPIEAGEVETSHPIEVGEVGEVRLLPDSQEYAFRENPRPECHLGRW